MNWALAFKALQLIPYVVIGIEKIHGGAKSGKEKKDIALDVLGLSSQAASAVAPEHKPAIDAATSLASTTIDGVVTTLNAAGVFQKKEKP